MRTVKTWGGCRPRGRGVLPVLLAKGRASFSQQGAVFSRSVGGSPADLMSSGGLWLTMISGSELLSRVEDSRKSQASSLHFGYTAGSLHPIKKRSPRS